MPTFLAVIGTAAATLTALAVIGRYVILPLVHLARGTMRFLEDWNGQPARPGYSPVPGVMESIALVRAEVSYNHGTSIKDAVRRIETSQKATADLLALHLARFDQHLADAPHVAQGDS